MPSDFSGIFCLLPGRPGVNFSVSQMAHQSKEGFQAEPILGYFDVNLRPKLSPLGIYRGLLSAPKLSGDHFPRVGEV